MPSLSSQWIEPCAKYRKVASRSTSRLVAHPKVFRLFMKGKFDPYVLWPLALDLWPLNSRPVYCSRLYGNWLLPVFIEVFVEIYFTYNGLDLCFFFFCHSVPNGSQLRVGRDSISLLVANCGVFLWFNLTLDIKRSVCFCFNFSSHDYIWCSNANLLMKSNKWGVFNDRLRPLRHYGKMIWVMFNN